MSMLQPDLSRSSLMVAPDLPINLPTSLAAIWVVKVADLDILLELVKEPSRAEQNENDEIRINGSEFKNKILF